MSNFFKYSPKSRCSSHLEPAALHTLQNCVHHLLVTDKVNPVFIKTQVPAALQSSQTQGLPAVQLSNTTWTHTSPLQYPSLPGVPLPFSPFRWLPHPTPSSTHPPLHFPQPVGLHLHTSTLCVPSDRSSSPRPRGCPLPII